MPKPDDDKPITRGETRKAAVAGCGLVMLLAVIGIVLFGALYVMGCYYTTNGCH